MTGLLEFREKIKMIYSKNAVFILPVVKFLLAFLTFNTINGQMGYMTQIDNIAIVLIVALLCSFLPVGSIVAFAAVFSLLHMYALSAEVAIVGICVYLLMFLLFLRFAHKEALAVVLTPLLCVLKVPYLMPVAMGLLGTPASAVSVGCGVAVYYLLLTVTTNAATINTLEAEDATEKLRIMIDGLMSNKEMLVMIAAFTITVLVVYLIRRMSVDYSWTVAMFAGAVTNLVILLVGDLMYDTNLSVLNAILGSLVAVAAGKVIEFFRFCVDYSRTEKVQFEDDEYYYYVKAVPKMTVAAPTKTVKKINTQTRTAAPAGRSSQTASGRRVTTERVARPEEQTRGAGQGARQYDGYGNKQSYGYGRRGEHSLGSGRSVTINSSMTGEDDSRFTDDYEELF